MNVAQLNRTALLDPDARKAIAIRTIAAELEKRGRLESVHLFPLGVRLGLI